MIISDQTKLLNSTSLWRHDKQKLNIDVKTIKSYLPLNLETNSLQILPKRESVLERSTVSKYLLWKAFNGEILRVAPSLTYFVLVKKMMSQRLTCSDAPTVTRETRSHAHADVIEANIQPILIINHFINSTIIRSRTHD